jgi:hypothetical protein
VRARARLGARAVLRGRDGHRGRALLADGELVGGRLAEPEPDADAEPDAEDLDPSQEGAPSDQNRESGQEGTPDKDADQENQA